MDLTTVAAEAARLGPWAYLATLGPSGHPHVVPVHPAWQEGTCYVFAKTDSVKARNIARSPAVALHDTVSPETGFDHLLVDGMATVHTDDETKQRLWTGVFDSDLDELTSADAPDNAYVAITLSPARWG